MAEGNLHQASIVRAHRIGLARIWFQGIPIGVDLNLQDFSRWSIQYFFFFNMGMQGDSIASGSLEKQLNIHRKQLIRTEPKRICG